MCSFRTPAMAAGLALLLGVAPCFHAQTVDAREAKGQFVTFNEAAPALAAGPVPEAVTGEHSARAWTPWLKDQDTAIRKRLEIGEQDTLTNFLRFGTTFTQEPQLGNRKLLQYGHDPEVDALAERRLQNLMRALEAPGNNERLAHTRLFLANRGLYLSTSSQRDQVRDFFLQQLAHMRDEFQSYLTRPSDANSYQEFKDRGISLDTNLWPDFLIDQHLSHLLAAGLLKAGSVKRVAIVGPGLDFSNKENGNDFYPPQSIQPFAVLDSLLRLKLADPASIQIETLDISSEVNFHLMLARQRAAKDQAYTVQLPWNTRLPFAPEYRENFVRYWQALGGSLGSDVPPAPVPQSLKEQVQTRAVRVRPEMVRRVTPVDLDVVCQRLPLPEEEQFDLVIGTNVFVYYDQFQQELLRVNIASMLRPGGLLLSNDLLPPTKPEVLSDAYTTSQIVVKDPEHMFSYQKPRE